MEDFQPSPSQDLVDHAGTSTTTIPSDVIFEILSLVPAKSIIRLQSVSKLWFSIIRSKVFVNKFMTRSKTQPRLLLPLESHATRERFFFSVPEVHNNNDDDKPTTVIARYDMKLYVVYYDGRSSTIPVNGFICFRTVSGFSNFIAVCNPTTRQIVKLPDVRTNGRRQMHTHLGYDPVEDEYKVLRVMMMFQRQEYFVCTVRSSQKLEWRKIENTTGDNYQYVYQGICVDGAIYYGVGESKIVKFDVRYEKLEIIKVPKESNISTTSSSTLIDYKGKLCVVDYYYAYKQDMRLWILEDAEKQEWSSKTWAFPFEREGFGVFIKGVTYTGAELIFVNNLWLESCKPYCVYYYDLNKESTRKVEIHGMEDGDFRRICGNLGGQMFSCLGYVDNIRFL